jgi:hypothetical protein
VVIPVLANDTDADGDALSVTSATQGAHGTVTVQPDGTIRYLAAADFVGVDTFTYVVSDGTATDSTTVTVTVSPPLDSDGDGIPDHGEDVNHDGTVDRGETDPRNPDTNGDGILDGVGVRGGGCGSGPGGGASLLLVGMAALLRRRGARVAPR